MTMPTPARWLVLFSTLVALALCLLAAGAAQAPAPKAPIPPPSQRLPKPEDLKPLGGAMAIPEGCEAAHKRALEILEEMDKAAPPQVRAAAERYVSANQQAGAAKAWGDFAAGAMVSGEVQTAAWAGLKATEIRWTGETVTSAGVYLFHLGRTQDALLMLHCAYDAGERSPYLLEALAVLHQKLGDGGRAKQHIQEAQQAAPEDKIIETEAAFILTGQPPPAPPPAKDALGRCLADLEDHSRIASARLKHFYHVLDQTNYNYPAAEQRQGVETFIAFGLDQVRQQIQQARQRPDPLTHNLALLSCVTTYFSFTDALISTHFRPGSEFDVIFWADVLGMDPPAFGRDNETDPRYSKRLPGRLSRLHSGREETAYRDGVHAALMRKLEEGRRCLGDACLESDRRYCATWMELYDAWAPKIEPRIKLAAFRFDHEAAWVLESAEEETARTRAFAVETVGGLRPGGYPMTAPDGRNLPSAQYVLEEINRQYRETLLDGNLGEEGDVVGFLRHESQWFQLQRQNIEVMLAQEEESMRQQCEPVLQRLYLEYLQEKWQDYLAHLRGRLAWGVEHQFGDPALPCEVSIGPASYSFDFLTGESKFDLKAQAKGLPSVSGGGKWESGHELLPTPTWGIGVSGGPGSAGAGTSGVSFSGSYGGVAGKANMTLTSKRSPYNNQDYTGIKIKYKFGVGGKKEKQGGMACYPASGELTLYPRALYEPAVDYMAAIRSGGPTR